MKSPKPHRRGQLKWRVLRNTHRLLPPLVLGFGMVSLALLSFSWGPDALPTITEGADTDHTSREQHGRSMQHVLAQQHGFRLLLASHSRLFWYEPETETTTVLHEGQGVHYGVFPGEAGLTANTLRSVWFVLRPHNWHPDSAEEWLVEVDASTGEEFNRHKISSRFSHDAVRVGDRVYVCSTESGEVLELEYPNMKELRRMSLFTRQQHVNTLAPLSPGSLWAMLHNLGQSTLVRVDLPTSGQPSVVGMIDMVGTKAHGIVEWRGWLLLLDSDGGSLSRVRQQWEVPAPAGWRDGVNEGRKGWHPPEVVYKLPDAAGKFLKGLCVVGDVAYFGISVAMARRKRDGLDANSELAAYDLVAGRLLWRVQVPSHGLLNIIAAPHLSEASTYRAVTATTGLGAAGLGAAGAGAARRTAAASGAPGGAGRDGPLTSAAGDDAANSEDTNSQAGNREVGSGNAASRGSDSGAEAGSREAGSGDTASGDDDVEGDSTTNGEAGNGDAVSSSEAMPADAAAVGRHGSAHHSGSGSIGGPAHSSVVPWGSKGGRTTHKSRVKTGWLAGARKWLGMGSKGGKSHASGNPTRLTAREVDEGLLPGSKGGTKGRSRGDAAGAMVREKVDENLLLGIDDEGVRNTTRRLIEMGFPPRIGGRWSTGLPYLDLSSKRSRQSWGAGIQLPLMQLDVTKLKVLMESLAPEMWTDDYQKEHNAAVSGRDGNMAKFKPGVGAMYLIFSDRTIQNTYQYPYYDIFQAVLEPIIKQIVGADSLRKIVRLQFALMPPKTVIHIHRDMGGYANGAHRIHVPIATTPDVSFEVCPGLEQRSRKLHMEVTDAHVTEPGDCLQIPMAEGMVFELNNRLLHRVFNHSPNMSRVQLVVDVAEEVKPAYKLQPGTECRYSKGVVVCPKGSVTGL